MMALANPANSRGHSTKTTLSCVIAHGNATLKQFFVAGVFSLELDESMLFVLASDPNK